MLRRTSLILFALFATCFVNSRARGDVGVVLNDSLNTSVERITGSGHTAVYFSRICPASPVKLRLCEPGEEGSVMSNYTSLGEDQPYEWNVTPLSVYLYGAPDPQDRPLFSSWKIKYALDDQYRENTLNGYCETQHCVNSNDAEWREMVSATSERTVYIFVVKTTVEQDLAFIEKFNSLPNRNHFNGARRNCADFVRTVVNTYFPHATRRNVVNDFGVTGPKALARSFAIYAHHHPESEYRVMHFAQLPGTIKRSSQCREATEQLYRSKKLLIPMAYFAYYALPFIAGSYLVEGRFNAEHEFERHPTVRATEIEYQLKLASLPEDGEWKEQLKADDEAERAEEVGTPREWARYREEFSSIVDDAIRDGILPDREVLGHVLKDLNEKGTPRLDERGELWLEIHDKGGTAEVGIEPANVLAPGSNRNLAYQILMAHVEYALKSSPRMRENISDFEQTWNLLQQARTQVRQTTVAGEGAQPPLSARNSGNAVEPSPRVGD